MSKRDAKNASRNRKVPVKKEKRKTEKVISQNQERNMQMIVTPFGETVHCPIVRGKPSKPKSDSGFKEIERIKKVINEGPMPV